MQKERITWKILPDVGNPCKLCEQNEATWFATMEINSAGSLTIPLCDECVTMPEAEILERILP